ncbi:MAG: MBL fold metallo-hydrolase [Winogradskyella sp.]|uniref:MBL fold metallo-hydrolase n=1 Tax=Winogradskyella sp. TaxID=1883156 RepID=UPI000F3F624B|nr:MBL fold metallo-hydrolase [Winogradskyella sp.]RNC87950.1 MAG: MBL fold metallo-hydrolase [Winogradskyella sp.]
MKIHHIRNATMIIETGEHVILIDPMLGKKGTAGPPFTLLRYKPRRNPIVDLPDNCQAILDRVTHCLITHKHPDHIDKAAEIFLKEKNIPITCSVLDEALFKKKELNVVQTIDYWNRVDFLNGQIEGIPARHGYGYVAKPMGNVMGFYLEFPNEPSVYLSSDTIYTDDVEKVLKDYKPDVSVVASGTARLDVFQPLLMRVDDILKFAKTAPGKVIANHLEAVNHCPTKREDLRAKFEKEELSEKTFIPKDGELLEF